MFTRRAELLKMADSSSMLREKLKSLENPAFAISFDDPEDDEITAAKVVPKDNDLNNTGSLRNFGNLRKTNFPNNEVVDDPKYFGNKVSRKSLKEWSDDDDGGDGDDISVNNDLDSNDDVEISSHESNQFSDKDDNVTSDNDEGSDVEEQSIDDFSDNELHFDPNNLPEDMRANIKSIEEDDDDDEIDNFTSNNVADELQKGQATKMQLNILDKLLESRIRLQRSLSLSNRLPQVDNMKEFQKHSRQQTKDLHGKTKVSLLELLKKLIALQDALLQTNVETSSLLSGHGKEKNNVNSDEEIASETEDELSDKEQESKNGNESLNLPSKRKHNLSVKDYEEEISKRHKAFRTYRDKTINKWYEKTKLADGKISSKGFQGFDKSTMQQIKQILSDKERLIKRTQLKRTPFVILGEKQDHDVEVDQLEDSHLNNYDENIFDDGDFYHEMLKGLIERKSNVNTEDPIEAGRQWLELQKLRTKIKRKIDTRASKGRKVRYDVHSKLVSFMAPQGGGAMPDHARNDLFSSLFGKKVEFLSQ